VPTDCRLAFALLVFLAPFSAALAQTSNSDARIASEVKAMPKAELDILFDIVSDCRVAADTRSRQAKENCKRQLERWQARYATKKGSAIQNKVIFVNLTFGVADVTEGLYAMNPSTTPDADVAAARRRFEASLDDLAKAIRGE
jgi:hypothetical protein